MPEIGGSHGLSQRDAIEFIPLNVADAVRPEDALGRTAGSFLLELVEENGIELRNKDVLVVSSKVATIFEGGQVRLDDVVPSRKARMIGRAFRGIRARSSSYWSRVTCFSLSR